MIKENKVLSNISWILLGRIIYLVLNFIVTLISARYLGPSDYGLIGYAAAYTTFFASICNLGINSIILKEFIDNPNEEGKIIGTTIFLKFLSCIFSFVIINGLCFIVDRNEFDTKIVVLLYSVSIFFQIFETFKYRFQSKLQSKYSEIATTIAYVFMALYKIALLMLNKGVKWFAISNSIELFIVAILLYLIYKKKDGKKLSIDFKYGKKILKLSYHFIISGTMVAIYNSTDKFMLKKMLDEVSVAYYSTAITLSSLITFVLAAIIESITPVIMEAHKKGDIDGFNEKNRQLYSLIFYLSGTVSIIICVFAKYIIEILYGKNYLGAINPLRILTWYTAFSYLGVARNAWVVAENRQSKLIYIYISSAIINVILNFLLIPLLGASGASLASLITQISTVFIIPVFVKGLKENVLLMINGLCLKKVKKN